MTVPYTFGNTTSPSLPLSRLDDNFAAVGNSINVSFTQNGTGAVARTSQSKMAEIVSVKDFGAVGNGVRDDTADIQAALTFAQNTSAPVYVPTGTYRITSGLVYSDTAYGKGLQLYGDGMYQSVFKMDANNQIVFTVQRSGGGGGENFTSHGHISNIGLEQFVGRTGVTGMRMANCWYYTFENINASNLTGEGFETYSIVPNSDVDIVALCTFKGLRAKINSNNGFKVTAATGAVGLSQSKFEFCDFSGNGANGMLLQNFDGVELFKCAMTANGTGVTGDGISVQYNGIANRNLVLRGCEIGNGNKRAGLRLTSIVGVLSEQNRWIQNNGEAGLYAIEFASSSLYVRNFTDKNSYILVGLANVGVTAYYGGSVSLQNVRIENPYWAAFNTSTNTQYSFASPKDLVIVENEVSKGVALGYNRVSNPVSYAPDAFEYKHHVIVLQTISSTTIDAPLNPFAGREIDIVIWNVSGGAVTVTFNSVFKTGGYSNPATGFRASARFVYDALSAAWVQVGAWATNVPS